MSAARLLTSGWRPWDRRVSVEALTPDSVATSFQLRRRERLSESSAACNAVTSKRFVRAFIDFTLAIDGRIWYIAL